MFRYPKIINVAVKHAKSCSTAFCSASLGLTPPKENLSNNIVKSKVSNINIPTKFIDELIWEKLDKWHNKTAMVCCETGRSYLYSELYQQSKAVASFLQNKIPGLKQKDVIAIILPNIPEFAIVALGIMQAGFTITTVNPNYTSDEIFSQLQNTDVKFIFTINSVWPNVQEALRKINSVAPTAIVKHWRQESVPTGTINFDEMVKYDGCLKLNTSRNVDDVAAILCSSGTTGLPKGVELTHKTIVSNFYQSSIPQFRLVRESEGTFQEVVPLVLPMFHSFGFILIMVHCLAAGSKLVSIPKFTPEFFVDLLDTHRPTFAHLVPPLVLFLINHERIQPKHISQLGRIFCAAAPLGEADVTRLHEKSKIQTVFLQGYGLTEASPLTHLQTPHISGGLKSKGAGLLIPNTEFLISPSNTDERIGVGPFTSGEIYVRGPQVMKGYYKNKEATEATIDKDGWMRTGDIAYYDEDGHLFITDRLKELIKVKGFQVAPAELEEILRNHPDVEDAAVIGVPHKEYGEVPKAFVVTKRTTDTSKIQEYVCAKVISYKHLKGGIVILDSIPKTASGKILRRVLRNLN